MRVLLTPDQAKEAEEVLRAGEARFSDAVLLGQIRPENGRMQLVGIPIPQKLGQKIRRLIEKERQKLQLAA